MDRRDRAGEGAEIVATQAAATVKDMAAITHDCSPLEWSKSIYVPLGLRLAIPSMARSFPSTCSICSQGKFWRDCRIRDPIKVEDAIKRLVNENGRGFSFWPMKSPS